MQRRRVIQGIIAVAAIAVIVAAGWVWQRARKTPVKIGAILSLSAAGSPSEIGIEVRDGMLLAAEAINAWGGINGRKVEVIVADSESNPQKAQELFQQLEAKHRPVMYISTLSSVSVALASAAEANNVVLMALVTTTENLTTDKRWTFRYWPSASNETPPTMALARKLRITRLGVLYLDDEYGCNVFDIARAEWEKTGGTIHGEAFQIQETTYSSQIASLSDMDAILAIGYPGHVVTILKRLKEEDFQGIILSNNSATLPSSRSLPQTEGVYAMAPILYNPDFLFARELSNQYEMTYNKPLSHFAANGYDAIKMLASLLEDQDISRDQVKALLEAGFIYPGVFGDIHVEPGVHDITFPLYPAQIVNGDVKYLRGAYDD